jgi:SRSO17 transposase
MNSPICRKSCGIPIDLTFKTKAELGLEMILDAKNRNIPFGYVGMDTFYGQQSLLLNEFEKENIVYIADIPCDKLVWLNKPETGIPPKKGKRGRKPKNIKVISNEKSIRIDKLAQELDSSQYHRIFVRDSERKKIWCELACLRVYSTDNSLPGNECWLIIRRTEGEKKLKYQFSNAPLETSLEKFGKMSYSRYWIERAIEDAKSDMGLADYEVRGYLGWNHHMAMTILAMLFLMEMQDEWLSDAPLLTLTDVRKILIEIMPKRKLGSKEILNLIEQKHKARYSAKRSHHKRSG